MPAADSQLYIEKPSVILLCIFFNRYMNGAASNPDAHAFAHAAAQVKKGLEIAKKLGAENFGRFNQTCRHLPIVLFISSIKGKITITYRLIISLFF